MRTIAGYHVLHPQKDRAAYMDALMAADLVSTATYPDGFDAIVEDIAELVRKKMAADNKKPMAITLGANYVGLLEYYQNHLDGLLSEEEKAFQRQFVPLVASIIYRSSSYASGEQLAKDPLAVQGDDWDYLQVEQSAFRFGEEYELPKFFLPEDDILKLMTLKIWIGNTLHCSYAFLGHYYGLSYTCESARNDYVSRCAYYASDEGYTALAHKFGLPLPRPKEEEEEIWHFYRNEALKDSLLRVAADPIRKLGRNERFIGPALMCLEYDVIPAFICHNAAYGFTYKNEADPTSLSLLNMVAQRGIEAAVEEVCGLDLSKEGERLIHRLIVASYREICDYNPTNAF